MAQSARQAITGRNSFDDKRYRPSSVDDLTNLPYGINTVVLNKNIPVQTGPSTIVTISNGSYLVFCYHADDSHQNTMCLYLGQVGIYWIQNYQGDITAKQLVWYIQIASEGGMCISLTLNLSIDNFQTPPHLSVSLTFK